MPLCQVNIADGAVVDADTCTAELSDAISTIDPSMPVIVLIHGFKFSPYATARDPHTHILGLDPRPSWKAVSWPRRLGLGQDESQTRTGAPVMEPLVIALGWEARGTLWQAYERAAETGAGLAALIGMVQQLRAGTAVQILAHSLGGRVALSALPHLGAGAVGRMVLLAAAEMQSRAAVWLDCPAGRTVEVLNVRSRENAVFDRILEWLVAPQAFGDHAIGAGLAQPSSRWLDLAVDDAATRHGLETLGFRVPAPDRRICHWSVYLRSGLFDVYRAVLTEDLPFAHLRAHLPPLPSPRARRWTMTVPALHSLRRGTS